ncbi:MAG TPA: CopD family protein [Steroidobacteraceae bacterium]|nr:CopD family protein [Steroidobacteraceae bacterium]
MLADIVSSLIRALSFIALFQAAGVVIFIAIFGRYLDRTWHIVRRVGLLSALAGLMLVAAHYGLEAARMAGDLRGVLDLSLQSMVLHSAMSAGAAFQVFGLALIVTALGRSGRNEPLGLAGAASSLVGFLFVGHTATDADRSWLAGLLMLHLTAVAFWFGGLWPLFVVARREAAGVAASIVDMFSRIATWWVPVILLAGAAMTLSLVDSWSVFAHPYGLILLIKVIAFAVLMLLASLNKWRYAPALAVPRMAIAFQRSVAAEYFLICAVLAATAIMTTFFSPEA